MARQGEGEGKAKAGADVANAKAGLRVAIVHPDLGLGGAERLIVDAATELGSSGRCAAVDVYTAHHDPSRCFEETREQRHFRVIVRANWFPRTLLGRCVALCAYVRCLLLALHVCLAGKGYDVVLVDQVSVAVLPLQIFRPLRGRRRKVVFYCHYPDQLLSTQRRGWLKRAYRAPLDWLEEWTTGLADVVLVNSNFTKEVFFRTFKRLAARNEHIQVLYPAVQVDNNNTKGTTTTTATTTATRKGAEGAVSFLSINRFERKKNIALAIMALKELHESILSQGTAASASLAASLPRLVIAGGYDARLRENVDYLAHLKRLAATLEVSEHIDYFPSFTDGERAALLSACAAVVYTPENEHFGIVPLEAMAAGRPVVACNSGGPLETVVHGKTGFICAPTPAAFARAMAECMDAQYAALLGLAASQHVRGKFSRRAFGEALYAIISQ